MGFNGNGQVLDQMRTMCCYHEFSAAVILLNAVKLFSIPRCDQGYRLYSGSSTLFIMAVLVDSFSEFRKCYLFQFICQVWNIIDLFKAFTEPFYLFTGN